MPDGTEGLPSDMGAEACCCTRWAKVQVVLASVNVGYHRRLPQVRRQGCKEGVGEVRAAHLPRRPQTKPTSRLRCSGGSYLTAGGQHGGAPGRRLRDANPHVPVGNV